VSPPSSDFEGVAIIDTALNKYSKRRTSKLSDADLISQEISQRRDSTPKRERNYSHREAGSFSSLESGASSTLLEAEPFGAMLRSYARNTEPQVGGGVGSAGIADRNETREGEEDGAWSPGETGEREGEGEDSKENFKVAMSLNYEVRERSEGREERR
jgi:hypothetical protein